VAREAEMLRASLLFRQVTELTQRYAITGRAGDLDRLRESMDEAAELFARLESAFLLGTSFSHDLAELRKQVEGPGLRAPVADQLTYEDDMAHGGFSRRDADRIDGFYAGQYGLALLPGKSGRVAYTVEAAAGRRFESVEIIRLVFGGSSNRIEVEVGGTVQVFAEDEAFTDIQHTHDLTPLVRGAQRFTLIFWAKNRGGRPLLCLDNWGLQVTTTE
jgi:hypothetical protein